jgi:hypothetical protein
VRRVAVSEKQMSAMSEGSAVRNTYTREAALRIAFTSLSSKKIVTQRTIAVLMTEYSRCSPLQMRHHIASHPGGRGGRGLNSAMGGLGPGASFFWYVA